MPQATEELRERWADESAAFEQLGDNFEVSRGGIISPKLGYKPTDEDMSAVEYLCQEWDYGYGYDP